MPCPARQGPGPIAEGIQNGSDSKEGSGGGRLPSISTSSLPSQSGWFTRGDNMGASLPSRSRGGAAEAGSSGGGSRLLNRIPSNAARNVVVDDDEDDGLGDDYDDYDEEVRAFGGGWVEWGRSRPLCDCSHIGHMVSRAWVWRLSAMHWCRFLFRVLHAIFTRICLVRNPSSSPPVPAEAAARLKLRLEPADAI